jgi:hypothetical protein
MKLKQIQKDKQYLICYDDIFETSSTSFFIPIVLDKNQKYIFYELDH